MILNIILIAILWIIVGVWICWKRDWYWDWEMSQLLCVIVIILAPINLLLTIFSEYILEKWKN